MVYLVPISVGIVYSTFTGDVCPMPRTPLVCGNFVQRLREIMLFIGKPKGRSMMISNATNPLKESRKESLLRCAGSTSICVWLVCDLVVMCVQAVGDRALGDLCVCVRCGSVQSQKV